MSELLNTKKQHECFRRNLLTNVSMLALLGYLSTSQDVVLAASTDDPPTLWIELGGQADRTDETNEILTPAFFSKVPAADLKPMIEAQNAPPFSIGGEGKITFTPHDSHWVLSASIIYGRADSPRHMHHQTPYPREIHKYQGSQIPPPPAKQQFGDSQTDLKESHAILDFRVGRDVGLGLFGAGGTSVISAGVRFAQFISRSDVSLHARPEYKFGQAHSGTRIEHVYSGTRYITRVFGYRTYDLARQTNAAALLTKRNAHAIGPSVSWNASLPVAGNGTDMTLTADWGIAGAILFGRQHTQTHHQTTGYFFSKTGGRFKYQHRHISQYTRVPPDQDRSRTVTIPNIGGFVGTTLKFSDIQFSLGYRADFFFGAMDGGIDTTKKENVGFYGPFATISVGFGG
jgi:hypothetical protein